MFKVTPVDTPTSATTYYVEIGDDFTLTLPQAYTEIEWYVLWSMIKELVTMVTWAMTQPQWTHKNALNDFLRKLF